jgi:hypothetical protein
MIADGRATKTTRTKKLRLAAQWLAENRARSNRGWPRIVIDMKERG